MSAFQNAYCKVPKVTTPQKQQSSESSDKMSQVLANPESSDPTEDNDPPKVETSNPERIKCHTDPRFNNNDYLTFLSITLKVQDIHYLFSKVFLSHFLRFYFLKCLCGVRVLAIRRQQASESSDSTRVINPRVTRVVTFGTLRVKALR